jgi:prepilin-type N-terminal cleavage/methylation domain-containing protein
MNQHRTLETDSTSVSQPISHGAAAFTLIEFSVVLVIIGLIVGGILVGRDLIATAEVKQIITDVEKFKTATYTFRDKYSCLPGDCANATTFFGISSTGCQTAATHSGHVTATGGTGTCNGEGHNIIGTLNWTGDEEVIWGGGPQQKTLIRKYCFSIISVWRE